MNAAVIHVDRQGIMGLISSSPAVILNETETKTMQECVGISQSIWAGFIHRDFACAWGLIPPTLLSNQAYLWLFTTPLIENQKFLFVRHSQRQVEKMLKEYPRLVGFCEVNNVRAIRWVKWLGGEFNSPVEGRMHFCIRGQHG